LYHDININIYYEYIIIRHFFIDFVLFQNNKVPRIISPFNGALSCWNKMCNITFKSFDDNKVLKKLSIGYANICSSVQDHGPKI